MPGGWVATLPPPYAQPLPAMAVNALFAGRVILWGSRLQHDLPWHLWSSTAYLTAYPDTDTYVVSLFDAQWDSGGIRVKCVYAAKGCPNKASVLCVRK